MFSSLFKLPKSIINQVRKSDPVIDFGTRLVNETAGTRLRAFLLNRLKITPGTVTRLIKRYQVKVVDSNNQRLHPTMLLKLPQNCSIQLQGFRFPERGTPLFPQDDVRWDVMKNRCFSELLKETLGNDPVKAAVKILYEDEKILAINKPYNIRYDDALYLGRVKEKASYSGKYLQVVNKLELYETGVLLFAKDEASYKAMIDWFNPIQIGNQVQAVYWAMTSSVYKSTPFGEIYSLHYRGREDHRLRFKSEQRWTSHLHLRADLMDEGESAITQWRHLSTHIARTPRRRKLGLYELAPITLRPDQIRVQLAEQLKCPVLGDWLYSPKEQTNLRISSNYPLHLHLYALRLKDYLPKNGNTEEEMLEIKAPIPPHFIMSMNKYVLFLPKDTKAEEAKDQGQCEKVGRSFSSWDEQIRNFSKLAFLRLAKGGNYPLMNRKHRIR